jgi:Ca2+-binding EF-hand superfamily protein
MTYAEVSQYDFGSWKSAEYTGTKIPTFDEFIKSIYEKLGDNKSQNGIQRLFEMFKNGNQSNNLTLNDLRNIANQLNENISENDLEDMMNRISEGKGQLTFEQFYNIIKDK